MFLSQIGLFTKSVDVAQEDLFCYQTNNEILDIPDNEGICLTIHYLLHDSFWNY